MNRKKSLTELINENVLPDNFKIPDNYLVRCGNDGCKWVGILSDCPIEMDSEGWEYPEYEVLTCPKCGDFIEI